MTRQGLDQIKVELPRYNVVKVYYLQITCIFISEYNIKR